MRETEKQGQTGDKGKDIIMVVDDNPANLEVISNFLQRHGMKTAIASDGHIALKRAGHLLPDLILLDILMPGIDGIETCRRLKADPNTRDIPIIFMTALTERKYKAKGFSAGGVDYITKPIHYEELLARVKAHLEIQRYRKKLEQEVRKRTLELENRTRELETANEQLKQLQHTFLTVLDSIDASVYVSDLDNDEILFMNRYAKDLLGADYTGERCCQAFYGQEKPCSFCVNEDLLNPDGLPTGVYSRERYDLKTNRWYMNSDRAIKWIDGRYVHIQVAMDITRVKELEAEKIKTKILLGQAQKMEAIGTLAGGIAHDFNNILSPIIGYVEMMLADIDPGHHTEQRNRERLQKVLDASNRARDLVTQILNFSRQSDDEPRPMQVQSILKEVLRLVAATLPATIEIHQEIDENCSLVVADPAKIHQITMNLITNAYHAMEDTGGQLRIALKDVYLEQSDVGFMAIEEGHYVCLQISDTGIGMDKATIDRIFDPYFTTKEMGKGTGLGLAVAHGIVAKCGGGIEAESSPGKGSLFNIYLPVAQQINGISQEPVATAKISGGTETVLLVDDEPQIVELEKMMLENLGYRVEAQTSSPATLALFREKPLGYDLLITDMTMPELTGDKLAKEVLNIRPDMPVIICTGYSEKINDEKAKSIGAKALLMKPFGRNKLAGAIRAVLDSSTERQ